MNRLSRSRASIEAETLPDDGQNNDALPPGIVRARPIVGGSPARPNEGGGTSPSLGREGHKPPSRRTIEPAAENRITALEEQEKNKNRVSVFIDGTFALGLFADVAHALGLRIGQELTPERLTEIVAAETRRRALDDAYHLLSFRARSQSEIETRLKQKEYEPEIIAHVVSRLTESGYLDDQTFAEDWVGARGKTRGRRALAHELRQKGVTGETAAQALTEARTDEAEQSAARFAAIKRVGERPADTSRPAQAKLSAYLQRRGFSWGDIRPVLAELYGRRDDDADTLE